MADQRRKTANDPLADQEDCASMAARKARKNLLNQEMLAKLARKKDEQRRRARKYVVNTELLETNGAPGGGARIIDLSMNGARLELPFSPPFMSQMTLKFTLQGSKKIMRVVGRVIWSRIGLKRNWYEVGVQFYQNYWEIEQLLRLEQR
jgi:hypothetical protein